MPGGPPLHWAAVRTRGRPLGAGLVSPLALSPHACAAAPSCAATASFHFCPGPLSSRGGGSAQSKQCPKPNSSNLTNRLTQSVRQSSLHLAGPHQDLHTHIPIGGRASCAAAPVGAAARATRSAPPRRSDLARRSDGLLGGCFGTPCGPFAGPDPC